MSNNGSVLPPMIAINAAVEAQKLAGKKRIGQEKVPSLSKKQQIGTSIIMGGSHNNNRSISPTLVPLVFSPSNNSIKQFPAPVVIPSSQQSTSPSGSFSLSSSPLSSSMNENLKHQINNQIWIWEQLVQREQGLLDKLKQHSVSNLENEGEIKYQQIQQEIRSFFEHKMRVLIPFVSDSHPFAASGISLIEPHPSITSLSNQGVKVHQQQTQQLNNNSNTNNQQLMESPKNNQNVPSLSISQQPLDVIIANRYIVPAPSVVVNIPKNYNGIVHSNQSGLTNITLVLSASLLYHLTDKEVIKTMDGKQDILQGVKRISIDLNGILSQSNNNNSFSTTITFSKLKILEVSSKHKHQPFSIIFSIEEYTQGSKKIISSMKSTLFQVLSRPTSTHYGGTANNQPNSTSTNILSNIPLKKLNSQIQQENLLKRDDKENSDISKDSGELFPSEMNKAIEGDSSNMILQDITELLTLPQKEAASKLGISESMLCKRFKESTRRKWPYRYLRKLEKVIKMLHLQENDGFSSKEDKEKLERLVKEKEECLRPVKIRITANDRINSLNSSNSNQNLSSLAQSPIISRKEEKTNITCEDSNEETDEETQDDVHDDDHFVLETLEMLKTHRSKAQNIHH